MPMRIPEATTIFLRMDAYWQTVKNNRQAGAISPEQHFGCEFIPAFCIKPERYLLNKSA